MFLDYFLVIYNINPPGLENGWETQTAKDHHSRGDLVGVAVLLTSLFLIGYASQMTTTSL